MRSMLKVAVSFLVENIKSAKMLASLLIVLSAIYIKTKPLTYYSEYMGYNFNLGILVFLLSDGFVLTITFIAMTFIFSDIPFRNPKQYFLLSRLGKRKWIFAHLFYIMAISILITGACILTFLLIMRGHVYFGNSWGKLVSSMPETLFPYESGISIQVQKDVLTIISPTEAILWTMITQFFINVFFGSICVTFNMLLNEYAGTIICSAFIFVHLLRGLDPSFSLNYFSPIDWVSVNVVDFNCNSAMPDWNYSLTLCVVIIVSLWIVNFIVTRKNSKTLEAVL